MVLYGSTAAGLGDVRSAMESEGLFGKSRTYTIRECSTVQQFSEQLGRFERPPKSQSLVLVPPDLQWDKSWVVAASERIGQFTSKDTFLTVLFVANPQGTSAVVDGLAGASEKGVRELTLHPWHDAAVRQWLQESNLHDDLPERTRINET